MAKKQTVTAKFKCNTVRKTDETHKTAFFNVFEEEEKDNNDFTSGTPGGNMSILIEEGSKADKIISEGSVIEITFSK